ncbi:MAG: hypothetical protein ACXAEF_07910 [Candidatus Thorarchaeota archaeon]|jgi:phosphoserine phosphatase
MQLQIPSLDSSLGPLLLALSFTLLLVGGYIRWSIRRRNRIVAEIDRILFSKISLSLTELIEFADAGWVDTRSLLGVIGRSEYAILSFSKTSVVSAPLLSERLKETLVNNSVIRVDKEAIRWDVAPAKIRSLVEEVSERQSLDVLATTNGDFLLVPDLKERIRDSLELQGRADIVSEAQRLHVDVDELIRLVQTWGWYVWQSSAGLIYSVRWLLSTLERNVGKRGYLDIELESERLDLTEKDILTVVRLYKWDFTESGDGKLYPSHILQEQMLDRLEQVGFLDVNEESMKLKIPTETLIQLLTKTGLTVITTSDGSIMTLDQLRSHLLDDLELAGIIRPQEAAQRIGIDVGLAERVMKNHPGIRKSVDGRYISYRAMRSYILDEVQRTGRVNTTEFKKTWTINRVELAAILKRFGLRVLLTKAGNYLSVSWVRRKVRTTLETGGIVEPESIADEHDTDLGVIEAIISGIETDTILDNDGNMVSRASLFIELENMLHQSGTIDPENLASEHGFDIADINRVIRPLRPAAFVANSETLVSKTWLTNQVKDGLKLKGLYNLKETCDSLDLEFNEISKALEERLDDEERIVDVCGVIISSRWHELLNRVIKESGRITVSEFANTQGLPMRQAVCLLRNLLKGVYVSGNDTFFAKT